MPTRKSRRSPPPKKTTAKRATLNLKQLRKKIDDLKKKFEQYASKTGKVGARSIQKDRVAEMSPHPEVAKIDDQGLARASESVPKLGGKRELARRMILARIAEVRTELANRKAELSRLVEGSKHRD
jgi:hypothetical protein